MNARLAVIAISCFSLFVISLIVKSVNCGPKESDGVVEDMNIDKKDILMLINGLNSNDIMTRREEVITRHEDDPMTPPPSNDKLVFSLSGGTASIRIELPLPLDESTWNQLTGMISALKPALVAANTEEKGRQHFLPQGEDEELMGDEPEDG